MKKQLLALMALVVTGNVFAGWSSSATITNNTGGYILAQLYNPVDSLRGFTSPQQVIGDGLTAKIDMGGHCLWGIRVWKCDANGNNKATDSKGKVWFLNTHSSVCGSMDNVQVTTTQDGQLISGNNSYTAEPCNGNGKFC